MRSSGMNKAGASVLTVLGRPASFVAVWLCSHPRLVRSLLAGPVAAVLTVLVMGGMAVWVPAGDAGVNSVALPVVLSPLIWAVFFFYAVLDDNLARATGVMTGLTMGHLGLIVLG